MSSRAGRPSDPRRFRERSGLRRLLAALMVLLLAEPALALDPRRELNQCRLRFWNTSDGLPQNAITALLQTPDGYLWIGTQGGLARFDGVAFEVFDQSTEPAFSDDFITALAADPSGTLWIGTRQGLIRRKEGRFEKLTERHGLPDDYVRSLLVDRRGALWVGTYGGGLARLEKDSFRSAPLLEGKTDILVRVLFDDSKGRLWVGTSRGLLRIEDRRRTLFTERDGLQSLFIRAVAEDDSGRIWVGTEGAGLHVERAGRFERWNKSDFASVRTVRAMLADRQGSLWIGTRRQGLFRLRNGVMSRLDTQAGMPHDFILSILEDDEGGLWLGTRLGLAQILEGRITTFTKREGLADESVRSILQSHDGRIWVGTEGGGLQMLRDGRFVSPPHSDPAARAQIRSLFEDHEGNLMLGTRSGIIRLGPDGRQVFSSKNGLPHNVVNAFEEDDEGNLWIGTSGGVSLMAGDRFQQPPVAEPGLSNHPVRALLRDRRGRIWIATESGLNSVEKDGEVRRYTAQFGLANDFILSLHEDQSEALWVGTVGGLSLLRGDKFVNFGRMRLKDNPFHDPVFRILEDDGGGFWMCTPKGILLVPRNELLALAEGSQTEVRWERFNESDGLINSECNGGSQPAGWRTSEGHLWFPTVRGIAMIDPEQIHRRRPPPHPVIDLVRVGNRQVGEGPVRVPPHSPSLEIRYAAPTFVTPERTRFRYRLEGFHDDWVEAEDRRAAFFTNLSPGSYRFHVAASHGDGAWSPVAAVLEIEVEAAFHQTLGFRLAAMLGVAALFLALLRWRVKTLEKRRKQLRDIIEERTLQLQQANRSLRALASVDDLTQLANHRSFREQLQSEWRRAARAQHTLSLIVIDIDFFKKFNDEYGHLAGDRRLKQVAAALEQLIRREGEMLARYGGEEFVALLPGVSVEEAGRLAERLRASIEELGIEHRASPIAPVITVSAGVAAASPQPGQDPEQLFEAADKAMYVAKREGRNRVARG